MVTTSVVQFPLQHKTLGSTMSDIKDGVNVKIKTVKIKDEPDEEKCSEGSLEDIVHEEEEFSRHSDEGISLKTEGLSFINATGNIFPSGTQMDEIQHLSCGVTCRGQLALEKHMLERHKSSQGNEGVAWGKQSGCGLPILSTIILPGPLWSGERRVTFHHCPECPQCFQCLKSQNCVLRGAENGEETPREVAETLYHCVKCGKLFRQKGALRGHHRTHAEAVAQACANQRKTLKLSTPPVHRIQSMKTLYHCDGSKETMGKLCAAKTDGNEHATKQSYHCEACGLDFSLHRSLCDHQRAHRDVVFDCTVCGKSFRHARNLERHQRVHMGETPYQCRDCDKTFSQVGSLRLHQRVHTGETPYRCTFCEKSFSQLENLKRHRRTHTGETPYPCNECGKSFSQLGNLKAHLRIHTGETPFSCSVCGKSFKNKGNLKAHCRIHTGETPFQCKDCGKSFGWLAALKTHQRTHTGEKPYHCERCGERFTYSYKLHTHGCHAS